MFFIKYEKRIEKPIEMEPYRGDKNIKIPVNETINKIYKTIK